MQAAATLLLIAQAAFDASARDVTFLRSPLGPDPGSISSDAREADGVHRSGEFEQKGLLIRPSSTEELAGYIGARPQSNASSAPQSFLSTIEAEGWINVPGVTYEQGEVIETLKASSEGDCLKKLTEREDSPVAATYFGTQSETCALYSSLANCQAFAPAMSWVRSSNPGLKCPCDSSTLCRDLVLNVVDNRAYTMKGGQIELESDSFASCFNELKKPRLGKDAYQIASYIGDIGKGKCRLVNREKAGGALESEECGECKSALIKTKVNRARITEESCDICVTAEAALTVAYAKLSDAQADVLEAATAKAEAKTTWDNCWAAVATAANVAKKKRDLLCNDAPPPWDTNYASRGKEVQKDNDNIRKLSEECDSLGELYRVKEKSAAEQLTMLGRIKATISSKITEKNSACGDFWSSNNYRWDKKVGSWGGWCTCPNGEQYNVGDHFDACRSMACVGGIAGICNKKVDAQRHGMEVICGSLIKK